MMANPVYKTFRVDYPSTQVSIGAVGERVTYQNGWEVRQRYGDKSGKYYHISGQFSLRDDAWAYARMKNKEHEEWRKKWLAERNETDTEG